MTLMESIYNTININFRQEYCYVFYGTNKFNPLREFVNTQTQVAWNGIALSSRFKAQTIINK